MNAVEEQLKTLNQEAASLNADTKAAKDEWVHASARNAPQSNALEKIYHNLIEEEQRLDTRRTNLEAKLPRAGERTCCQPAAVVSGYSFNFACAQSQALCGDAPWHE